MTEETNDSIDWELTTWKGHRRAQHKEFLALPFDKKLEALEEMADFARELVKERQSRGLTHIDPETGELVPGTHDRKVGENPTPYPKPQ